jgi:hypothetical protein
MIKCGLICGPNMGPASHCEVSELPILRMKIAIPRGRISDSDARLRSLASLTMLIAVRSTFGQPFARTGATGTEDFQ